MSFSKLLLMAFVALSAAATVYAQEEYRQYEITPFFGTRFGGNIDLSQQGNPNVDYLKIKNSMDYGIMGSVTFWQNFQANSCGIANPLLSALTIPMTIPTRLCPT